MRAADLYEPVAHFDANHSDDQQVGIVAALKRVQHRSNLGSRSWVLGALRSGPAFSLPHTAP